MLFYNKNLLPKQQQHSKASSNDNFLEKWENIYSF